MRMEEEQARVRQVEAMSTAVLEYETSQKSIPAYIRVPQRGYGNVPDPTVPCTQGVGCSALGM